MIFIGFFTWLELKAAVFDTVTKARSSISQSFVCNKATRLLASYGVNILQTKNNIHFQIINPHNFITLYVNIVFEILNCLNVVLCCSSFKSFQSPLQFGFSLI